MPPDGTFLLRCEPRIWHWCGNDPVRAHYDQYNLNELLIAFGYATFDPDAPGLTASERHHLQAAETLARERQRGQWSEHPGAPDHNFQPGLGLNISAVAWLQSTIDDTAAALANQP